MVGEMKDGTQTTTLAISEVVTDLEFTCFVKSSLYPQSLESQVKVSVTVLENLPGISKKYNLSNSIRLEILLSKMFP